MVPASKYVMQGQLLGAINKESLFVFVDKLIPTSLLALVCCVCVSIQSATPCIISIQSATPCIVYYTYFYLFYIIRYFLLWNPGGRQWVGWAVGANACRVCPGESYHALSTGF